jgi:hypothetical protein
MEVGYGALLPPIHQYNPWYFVNTTNPTYRGRTTLDSCGARTETGHRTAHSGTEATPLGRTFQQRPPPPTSFASADRPRAEPSLIHVQRNTCRLRLLDARIACLVAGMIDARIGDGSSRSFGIGYVVIRSTGAAAPRFTVAARGVFEKVRFNYSGGGGCRRNSGGAISQLAFPIMPPMNVLYVFTVYTCG